MPLYVNTVLVINSSIFTFKWNLFRLAHFVLTQCNVLERVVNQNKPYLIEFRLSTNRSKYFTFDFVELTHTISFPIIRIIYEEGERERDREGKSCVANLLDALNQITHIPNDQNPLTISKILSVSMPPINCRSICSIVGVMIDIWIESIVFIFFFIFVFPSFNSPYQLPKCGEFEMNEEKRVISQFQLNIQMKANKTGSQINKT